MAKKKNSITIEFTAAEYKKLQKRAIFLGDSPEQIIKGFAAPLIEGSEQEFHDWLNLLDATFAEFEDLEDLDGDASELEMLLDQIESDFDDDVQDEDDDDFEENLFSDLPQTPKKKSKRKKTSDNDSNIFSL